MPVATKARAVFSASYQANGSRLKAASLKSTASGSGFIGRSYEAAGAASRLAWPRARCRPSAPPLGAELDEQPLRPRHVGDDLAPRLLGRRRDGLGPRRHGAVERRLHVGRDEDELEPGGGVAVPGQVVLDEKLRAAKATSDEEPARSSA